MKRALFVAGALVLGISAVAAQDPIAARKALMKDTGKNAGAGAAMVRGEAPFDLAKAKAIFVVFQDTATKAPGLFPDSAKAGEDTAALPKIWESKADFDAKFVKLGADAKAAEASVTDLDSFKTAFSGVTKNCGGCHELYRLKK
ncbi:cytochrome c [Bradyrhizobium sp. U87765 SZCCT0131]|uniref:c-type cytochrome n=1 Tax=unclassified Bradyrhizobium TaxID=2631580 RepID=UPI001BABE4E9|nr:MULTISPECIES: cytochrome c [unclassified Bradyrhizobium]MBR1219696.1 cytochrome c [Bradyrhizobium sp. U87765 SZCCT0131]MBR1262347.1 cytochrome c [Bradyrhizobium sp. U87765 SZCCT0134]MBR1308470.1 cytochrome c [Bradyrhizobium sp. U87765 SZCCT0110]MBR1318129.1 cytochrome c [Bradyrhizobium sp. U87765 SZCCT0109]MBR1351832.1 cytochrome c [Bradyrhizobium sp. U87765 SZCCT0048]